MFNLKSFLTEKFSGKKLPWQDLFKLFKEIIDSNNRSLDIITDLGEKLSGDYLFDIIYIKSAYHKLNNTVGTSIQKFDSLTQKKYSRLQETFESIDSRINAAIKDTAVIFGKAVLSFDDIAWDMAHEVGGKNLNLAEMKNQLKLNVPPGFAITTHAYDLFIEHNQLRTAIENLSTAGGSEDEQLDKLRYLILNWEVPPAVSDDIGNALAILKSGCKTPCFVAVRSSAEEEDGEFTFAGQFKTVLNVPAEKNSIEAAYKEVIASLFSREATAYLKNTGHEAGSMKMAVGCVLQIDAVSSGVIFSSSPENAADVMINASWGLGVSVVDGTVEPDLFMIKKPTDKNLDFKITDRKTGRKDSMAVLLSDGGIEVMATPADKINTPCLTDEQVYELASQAVLIERHFGGLQDIEWAADKDGVIYILQARPLRLQEGKEREQDISIPAEAAIIMEGRGTVVQRGTGAGPAFIVNHEDEIENVPRGAILVSKNDSSKFVKIMPYISAIITDTGAPVSHMASVCREFKIPTLVNAGDATKILEAGKVVTLHIDNEGSAKVYEGFIKELVKTSRESVFGMESIGEYRKKRQLLRYISPLHLVDPLMEDFTVEGCRTIHDVLRFIHEKSVTELIDEARHRGVNTDSQATVRLELPIPAALMVVDIGGGLAPFNKKDKFGIKEVTSLPLGSILKGMTYPGVWHSETVSLNVRDFLSSMVRMPDIRNDAESYVGYNLAVASRDYVNLNLRFGYHFNMIDCYCSEKARNNHIYFRFVGGATDIVKRSRRVNFIAEVLKEHGFGLNIKGDLLVARLSNISQDRVQELLDQLGRLISYTRQLDAMLHSDELVNRYTANFLAGKYGLN
jgi:pyruvate, water dikinase